MGRLKILIILAAVTFIAQIGFSFYYASEIVGQNITFNLSSQQLNDLQSTNQALRQQLATITSMEYLHQHLDTGKLIPITKMFKVTP